MRKLNLLLVVLALFAAIGIISSCEKAATDNNTTTESLVLNINDDVSATYAAGTNINYGIVISSGATLKTLTLMPSINGVAMTPMSIFSDNSATTYNRICCYDIPSSVLAGSKITLVFEVTDSQNRSKTVTKEFIVQSRGSYSPVFSISDDISATCAAGSAVNYDISITSNSTLKTLTVISTVNGFQQYPVSIFNSSSSNTYNGTYTYTIPPMLSSGDNITLLFTITDMNGNTNTITKIITVKSYYLPLIICINDDISATYVAGSTLNYRVIITSGATLKNLIVTPTIAGSEQTPMLIFSNTTLNTYDGTYTYTIPATVTVGTKILLTFTITNSYYETQSLSKAITVKK